MERKKRYNKEIYEETCKDINNYPPHKATKVCRHIVLGFILIFGRLGSVAVGTGVELALCPCCGVVDVFGNASSGIGLSICLIVAHSVVLHFLCCWCA